ncbi:hypothetical protein ACFL67_03335 [candidate division KSB1 bacterium]
MKRLFIFTFVALLVASSAFAQTKWFDGTLNEAKAAAKAGDKLLIINFSSDGG